MAADQKVLIEVIATIFSERTDFCRTVILYSDESHKLIEKDFDNMQFLNKHLEEIPNPLVNETYYLILDLAILKERDPQFDLYRQESTEQGIINKPVYYASTNLKLPAFVVLDQNLDQLTDPFPYYVRAYSLDPDEDRVCLAAGKFNKRLINFYNRTVR